MIDSRITKKLRSGVMRFRPNLELVAKGWAFGIALALFFLSAHVQAFGLRDKDENKSKYGFHSTYQKFSCDPPTTQMESDEDVWTDGWVSVAVDEYGEVVRMEAKLAILGKFYDMVSKAMTWNGNFLRDITFVPKRPDWVPHVTEVYMNFEEIDGSYLLTEGKKIALNCIRPLERLFLESGFYSSRMAGTPEIVEHREERYSCGVRVTTPLDDPDRVPSRYDKYKIDVIVLDSKKGKRAKDFTLTYRRNDVGELFLEQELPGSPLGQSTRVRHTKVERVPWFRDEVTDPIKTVLDKLRFHGKKERTHALSIEFTPDWNLSAIGYYKGMKLQMCPIRYFTPAQEKPES